MGKDNEYQVLYRKYQDAVKLRELSRDKNFIQLREIFNQRIVSSITLSASGSVVPFLAGIKEVFSFVDDEVGKIDRYREELEQAFDDREL